MALVRRIATNHEKRASRTFAFSKVKKKKKSLQYDLLHLRILMEEDFVIQFPKKTPVC